MLTDVQMDLFFVMPTSLVLGFFYTRVLDIRNNVSFMATVFLLAVTINSYRSGFTVELKMALGVFYDLLLPLLFSRGRLSRRVMVVALAEVCLFADEILGGALWMLTTNAPNASYDAAREHFGAYVLMRAVHLAALVAMLAGLYLALNRAEIRQSTSKLWLLAGFPVAQFALISGAVFVGYYHFSESSGYYVACSAMVLLGLFADVLFLRALDRWSKAEAQRLRSEAIKRQLEEHYRHCEALLESAERMAKFRHDMRNHAQTISSLAERGQNAEAREYARELAVRLEEGGAVHA